MNILIPDSWLRNFLKTKATPKQIKEYLSLCGPSVERINTVDKETVYDIEVTSNRVDSYSVYGIAREAAAILPRFNISATVLSLIHQKPPAYPQTPLALRVEDAKGFCRRVLAVKLSNITLKPSPSWLIKRLELVGQRPINNIVDITNYIMWETGHPLHAFDYDRLVEKKIIIREAKKGEKVVTLDKKSHTMVGGELVFDDRTGTIIDVPGVMGTANTVVTPKTKNVLLFIENSDPAKIRYTSMTHAIRTQAAVINEKDPDPELAKIAMDRTVTLATELTGGNIASALLDRYPHPFKSQSVMLARTKLDSYMGLALSDAQISQILTALGFHAEITNTHISVSVPSFRRDIEIDVDIIEEVARIYGYHNIATRLPDKEPPVVTPPKELSWEEEIKVRLRDWGYTETYTYSMISENLMDVFKLDKQKTYKIANPLSEEWVYMRPNLLPSMLSAVEQNLHVRENLKLFELSMIYHHRHGDLPEEQSTLIVAWTGERFYEAKGLAGALFSLFGIEVPAGEGQPGHYYVQGKSLNFGSLGTVGIIDQNLLLQLGIKKPVTIFELSVDKLVAHAKPGRVYTSIPKFPPVVEDMAFIVPPQFSVGPLMEAFKHAHKLIHDVTLLDMHKDTRTLHITYLSPTRNLTVDDIRPIREKLIQLAQTKFNAVLKTA